MGILILTVVIVVISIAFWNKTSISNFIKSFSEALDNSYKKDK